MKRETIQAWAIGAGIAAVVLLPLGLVLKNQADFSKKYVRDQLAQQKISFLAVDHLEHPEQKKIHCLVANAGKPLLTGAQAECYANSQIGIDLKYIADGKTYSEISYPAKLAYDKANAAAAKDPTSSETTALFKEAAVLDRPVGTMFRGETLRGVLLTTYGFSLLGERGSQAATVCFILAAVLLTTFVVGLVLSRDDGGETTATRHGAEQILSV